MMRSLPGSAGHPVAGLPAAHGDRHDVVTRAAREAVGPVAAVERVVAVATVDDVDPVVAVELVVAFAAVDGVVACAAVALVGVVAGVDVVVACTARRAIASRAAAQAIVARAAAQRVVAGTAVEHVGQRRPFEQVVADRADLRDPERAEDRDSGLPAWAEAETRAGSSSAQHSMETRRGRLMWPPSARSRHPLSRCVGSGRDGEVLVARGYVAAGAAAGPSLRHSCAASAAAVVGDA